MGQKFCDATQKEKKNHPMSPRGLCTVQEGPTFTFSLNYLLNLYRTHRYLLR